MKTSFSVKVTGSITVSIEPSNEDGGGGGAADVDDNSGNVLVDVLLKSLVNDAIKKYAGDNGTTVDVTSPLPHRRIPADADDEEDDDATTDDGEADDADADDDDDDSTDDGEAKDEATDLPTVQVDIDNEYEEDYHLSQKMHMMSLRSPNLLE